MSIEWLKSNHHENIPREVYQILISEINFLVSKNDTVSLSQVLNILNSDSSTDSLVCVLRSLFRVRGFLPNYNQKVIEAEKTLKQRGEDPVVLKGLL